MSNEKTSNDLIKIESKPAVVSVNFDELKLALENELERYKGAVVTVDSLAADKKLVAEIRKRGKEIQRVRIDKARELAAPISEFEQKMKQLESMCGEVAANIDSQVKKFEAEKLSLCEQMLVAFLDEVRAEFKVESIYHMTEIDDLVKLTNLTATGRLSASAAAQVRQRVQLQELSAQQRTELRLAKLEAECYKQGLDAPLTKQHVQGFLYLQDDQYDSNLQSLIKSELERQEVARKRHEENLARESAKQQEPVKVVDQIPQEQRERIEEALKPATIEKAPDPKPEPEPVAPTADGKRTVHVAAYFHVVVPEHIVDERVVNKIEAMLKEAGFSTLKSVEVI